MDKSKVYSWDELDWIVMNESMRRKQIWLGNMMNVKIEIRQGTKAPAHRHVHEQTGNVVQGKLKLNIDGEEKTLDPGDGYIIAPNVLHSVESVGDEPVVILETFTPVREDLI